MPPLAAALPRRVPWHWELLTDSGALLVLADAATYDLLISHGLPALFIAPHAFYLATQKYHWVAISAEQGTEKEALQQLQSIGKA